MAQINKNVYFFALGTQTAVSIAEIVLFFDKNDILCDILSIHNSLLIVRTSENRSDLEKIFSALGGCIKYGVVLEGTYQSEYAVEEAIVSVCEMAFGRSGAIAGSKYFFGLSDYSISFSRNLPRLDVALLGKSIKKSLRQRGFSVRWVASRDRILSSVIVRTNRLLTPRGREIIIFSDGNGWKIGETCAVQAFADFSLRDYGRPDRDDQSGMLPPKLARMMVNMAGVFKDFSFFCSQTRLPDETPETVPMNLQPKKTRYIGTASDSASSQKEKSLYRREESKVGVICDPFCGSGTVVQEVLLLGFRAVGSDVSEKAVEDTRNNMRWLQDRYKISDSRFQIIQSDVRTLSRFWKENKWEMVDAIVTEPFLGPQKEKELRDLLATMGELSALYADAFREFAKIVKSDGRVVFIFPFFVLHRGKPTFMADQLIARIEGYGFSRVHLKQHVSKYFSGRTNISIARMSEFTERGSVLYRRPHQRVGREIFVWVRK